MKPDDANAIAELLTGAYPGFAPSAATYAWAIRDFDLEPMKRAVRRLIESEERPPSVKRLVGTYYGEKRADRAVAVVSGNVPCGPCQREGGYRIAPNGALHAPTFAVAPYLDGYTFTDDEGKPAGIAWSGENCCPVHAHQRTQATIGARRAVEAARMEPRTPPGEAGIGATVREVLRAPARE